MRRVVLLLALAGCGPVADREPAFAFLSDSEPGHPDVLKASGLEKLPFTHDKSSEPSFTLDCPDGEYRAWIPARERLLTRFMIEKRREGAYFEIRSPALGRGPILNARWIGPQLYFEQLVERRLGSSSDTRMTCRTKYQLDVASGTFVTIVDRPEEK